MIDREVTIQEMGYDPDDLPPKSHKKVWHVCDKCKRGRWLPKCVGDKLCMRCAHQHPKGKRIIKFCKQCGKKIETLPCLEHRKQFCSKQCEYDWKRDNMKGSKNFFFGKKHTDESRKKISDNHADVSGDKNPMYGFHITRVADGEWIGGTPPEPNEFYRSHEFHMWKDGVLERDNYTCQECGSHDKLCVHHILPYRDWKSPQYSLNANNGITLCMQCHCKIRCKEYEHFNRYFDIANGIPTSPLPFDAITTNALEA